MGYKINMPTKVIKMTENKDKILRMLDDVLKSCGFKVTEAAALIVDVTASDPKPLDGILNRLRSTAENIGNIFINGKGRTLPAMTAEFDESGNRLLQEYINDWIDIENESKFTSSDMESTVIDSSRILVMELFIRLTVQVLRTDAHIPLETKLTRTSWLSVLEQFAEKFFSPEYKLDLKAEDKKVFLISIEKLQSKWVYWLKSTIESLDEIESAKKIITENLNYCKQRELQIMRYIAIELMEGHGLNNVHHGCFADRQTFKSLQHIQLEKLNEYCKATEDFVLLDTAVVVENSGNTTTVVPVIKIESLKTLPWLDRKSINTQNTLCKHIDNPNLKKLYGLLNWTKLIIKMLEKIDEVIRLGNWASLMLNVMDLAKVDELLASHQLVYRQLINPANLPDGIDKTKLRMELSRYNLRDASRDVRNLSNLRDLQNKELLQRISDRLSDAFFSLSALGGVLQCQVVSAEFAQVGFGEAAEIPKKEVKQLENPKSESIPVMNKAEKIVEHVGVSVSLPEKSHSSRLFGSHKKDKKKEHGNKAINTNDAQKMLKDVMIRIEGIESMLLNSVKPTI